MIHKNIYYVTNNELLSLTKNDMYQHAKCIYAECAGDAAQVYGEHIFDSGNHIDLFNGDGLRVWVMQGHVRGEKMWWFDVKMVMMPTFIAGIPNEEANFSKGE